MGGLAGFTDSQPGPSSTLIPSSRNPQLWSHQCPCNSVHWSCSSCLQAFPHSLPSVCSALSPNLSVVLWAQLKCPPPPTRCPLYLQGEVAPPLCCPITAHVSPLGYPTTLHTPRPCCVFLLWTDAREPGSWSRAAVGIAWLLGRELRTSCGFLAWVEG